MKIDWNDWQWEEEDGNDIQKRIDEIEWLLCFTKVQINSFYGNYNTTRYEYEKLMETRMKLKAELRILKNENI